MNVGKKLKILRESNNISRTALADAVGVTQSYISQIESGKKKNITINTLHDICNYFGISLKEFFQEEIPELNMYQNKIVRYVAYLNEDEAQVVWSIMEQFIKKDNK